VNALLLYPAARFLEILTIGATAAFLMRLTWTRLIPAYRWLALYLLIDAGQRFLQIWLDRVGSFDVWRLGNTIKIPLMLLVAWDLGRLAFENHTAVAAFARKSCWYVVAGCVFLAMGAWVIDPPVPDGRDASLHYLIAAERAVTTGLFVFVAALGSFLLWFPVRMRRNVALYICGFVPYFGSRWISFTAMNLSPVSTHLMNLLDGSVVLVCLLYWTATINPAGEAASTVTGIRWNPGEVERLSRQLDAINASLSRSNQ
jgi:hypothetical protein